MDLLPIIIGVIVVLAVCYFLFVTVMKKKTPKKITHSTIDIEQLVKALGGKENIVSSSHSPSKLSVILNDNGKADIESIKALGASGIVENKDSLALIFGKASEAIDQDLKSYIG